MKWFLKRLEYMVAAAALAVVAVMIPWWLVFARRLIAQNVDLQERLHASRFEGSVEFVGDAERLNDMLTSEFVVVALSLISAIGALVYMARERRSAQIRMERLLQFTSHELKTPIAGVRALLQSLGLGSVPEEAKQNFIARGLAEVDRLEHLTETILAWQRSMAAADALTPSIFDPKQLIDSVLDHRRATGVSEVIEVSSLNAPNVLVHPDAFRVIFENLLDNVRKYGGGRSAVSSIVENGQWRFEVRDFGAGFPTEEAEAIFDPFRRRAHDGITHGSGLGLYLSRELAARMHGDLRASSEGVGCGCVFTLTLPLAEKTHG